MGQHFDAIVVGTGQAGPALAERMAKEGLSVAIMERELFGGTCVNTGCIPTKALVSSAHVAWMSANSKKWGVIIDRHPRVDINAVMDRKDRISGAAAANVERWLRGIENVTVITGHARFVDAQKLAVAGKTFTADRIFLNVGTRAMEPPVPGLQQVPWLTNSSIMKLREVPKHLIVLGGSYIGLEFAQMFRRFGSAVTIIQRGAQLAPREDSDVADAIKAMLIEEGISIRLDAECVWVRSDGPKITVGLRCLEGAPEVSGTHLLVATGRQPNTDDLGLQRAGIETDLRGYIRVNDALRTNVRHIWALGDCNGKGAFTHTAWNDYEIVAANLFGDRPRSLRERVTSYALYTDPPLGRIGVTEKEVRSMGRPALMGVRPMTRVGRALESGQSIGFMKVLVDAQTREILGVSVLGLNGDEAVQSLLDAVALKAPWRSLIGGVRIHPTVSELLPTTLQEMTPLTDLPPPSEPMIAR
jgi:pyruvate/2-oxoglutarate dehydrogenase complex dihydrolipoamide dehydrogenase (E3) component